MVAHAFVLVNVIKTLKQITKLNFRKQCDGGTRVRSHKYCFIGKCQKRKNRSSLDCNTINNNNIKTKCPRKTTYLYFQKDGKIEQLYKKCSTSEKTILSKKMRWWHPRLFS